MDKITYVKTKFRRDQWEKLITDYQNSGLKVDEWCEQNHISRHAYYYWLRKIRKQACESILPDLPKEEKSVAFAKLEVQTSVKDTQAAVIIHLPSATVEVLEGTSRQTVETVLLALKNIC
jgi:hypothetical protein